MAKMMVSEGLKSIYHQYRLKIERKSDFAILGHVIPPQKENTRFFAKNGNFLPFFLANSDLWRSRNYAEFA